MTETIKIPSLGAQRTELAKLVRLEEPDEEVLWVTVLRALFAGFAVHRGLDEQRDSLASSITALGEYAPELDLLQARLARDLADSALSDTSGRALFYANLLVASSALCKGDFNRAHSLLLQAARIKFTAWCGEFREQPGVIVKETSYMTNTKELLPAISRSGYLAQARYLGLSDLLIEALTLGPTEFASEAKDAIELLDKWAEDCESSSPSHQSEALVDWAYLIAFAGRLLQICPRSDVSEVGSPRECKNDAAQFIAWKFGYLIGRFALNSEPGIDDPEKRLSSLRDDVDWLLSFNREYPDEHLEDIIQSLVVVDGILREYTVGTDWQEIRKHYLEIWQRFSHRWVGMPLVKATADNPIGFRERDEMTEREYCLIAPNTDLHWAIRVGFVDRILEGIESKPGTGLLHDAPSDLAAIRASQESHAVRDLKQHGDLQAQIKEFRDMVEQRFPPAAEQVMSTLWQYHVGSVGRQLPLEVVDLLTQAELDLSYRRHSVANIGFCKAVEASLHCCFVEPLISFLKNNDQKGISLCFRPPRGSKQIGRGALQKLSLGEWAQVIEVYGKSMASPATHDLKQFLVAHLGGPYLSENLKWLVKKLSQVQQCRGGSAHFQDSEIRYERERDELNRMRDLVLGVNEPSVIAGIFRLLSHKEVSK